MQCSDWGKKKCFQLERIVPNDRAGIKVDWIFRLFLRKSVQERVQESNLCQAGVQIDGGCTPVFSMQQSSVWTFPAHQSVAWHHCARLKNKFEGCHGYDKWCPISATAQTNSGHLPQSTLPRDYPVSACLPYSDNLGKTTECDVAGKIYHAGGFTTIIVQTWDQAQR